MFGYTESIRAILIGATGGIGNEFKKHLEESSLVDHLWVTSRNPPAEPHHPKTKWLPLDITQEDSIAALAEQLQAQSLAPNFVFNCSGILHRNQNIRPERSWKQLSLSQLEEVFRINTFGVALLAKHLIPLMPRNGRSIFASLSARIGSIEDNRLGGWYSYRASKAAQNMIIKTLSIECRQRRKDTICVALHPGTVDTDLSKPFTKNYPAEKLFSSARCYQELSQVLSNLTQQDSGGLFAWDGSPIPY